MATYYVSVSGSNSNNGTAEATPWRTIQKAVTEVAAGDTVKIASGTYRESVRMNSSTMATGTSGNVITFEALDLNAKPRVHSGNSGKTPDWLIEDINYTTIRGIRFQDTSCVALWWLASGADVSNITVDQCEFIRCKPNQSRILSVRAWATPRKVEYVWLTDNYFEDCDPSNEKGTGGESLVVIGDVFYFYIAGNHLVDCWNQGIHVLGQGTNDIGGSQKSGQPRYGYITGNRVIGQRKKPDKGPGNSFYADRPRGPIVWEGNYAYTEHSPTGLHWNAEDYWDDDYTDFGRLIARNNVFITSRPVAMGNGPVIGKVMDRTAFYNNVIIARGSSAPAVRYDDDYTNADFLNNCVAQEGSNPNLLKSEGDAYNDGTHTFDGNIWTESNGDSAAKWIWNDPSTSTLNFTGWQAAGHDANGAQGTAEYINPASLDYRLTASSPGYNDAVALTTATNAGSSSTNLTVAESKFFVDGLNVADADWIDVGGTQVQIDSIDYSTNTITLATAITWSNGANVQFVSGGGTIISAGCWSAVPAEIGSVEAAPEEFTVDFTVSDSTPAIGDTVTLTDTTIAAAGATLTSWAWYYLDGEEWTLFSEVQNPTWNTYTTGIGLVSIRLVVGDDNGAYDEGAHSPAFVVSPSGDGCTGSILTNGDFASGDTGWSVAGSGISFDTSSGAAVVTTTSGVNVSSQFIQESLSVTDGDTMVVQFTASVSSGTCNLPVSLIQDNSPYSNLGFNETAALTTTGTTFTYSFLVTATESDARLRFRFHNLPSKVVTIDDVCLGTPDEEDPAPSGHAVGIGTAIGQGIGV